MPSAVSAMCRNLGLLLTALSTLACGSASDATRRILLVSVDTLRADHLGLHGYQRPTSPVLDALAAESTVFEQAISTSPWTLPAHGSMLTGLYPSRHGLVSHDRYLASSQTTLAQLFSAAGFRTAAVVNSHNLGPELGLDRGFQQYRYLPEQLDRREPSREITDQAMEWLAAAGESPLFLFLHYYDVHSDYLSLPEHEEKFLRPYRGAADGSTAQLIAFREGRVALGVEDAPNLIDRYDAGIRQMDEEIGRLLDFLREQDMMEDTIFVLTSDHGEEFFERGGVLHGRTQYEEVLRIPLILRGPGVPRGRRVETPVSLVDLAPTLLELAGIPVPDGLDGQELASLWSEEGPRMEKRHLFSEADHNNLQPDVTRAVRYGSFKLHHHRLTGENELYDLAADPGERVDLASERKEAAAALFEKLERFQAGGIPEGPVRALSEEEIEKLRSLGYLR